MAHQRETGRNGASIAKAGKRKWGYDVSQVDSFLERAHTLYEDAEPKMTQEDIQNVSFALEKNGYVISQVDAALNRLEKAVVDKQTQWDVASFGRVAWRATTEQLAHSLYPRSERPEKDRFSPGEEKKPSYDRRQVDRLVTQIVGKIRRELGESDQDADAAADAELTSMRVSNIIFTQRTGRHGYSERQVDAYLNRAVQVLSRLESFARLEGSLSSVEEGDVKPSRSAVQSTPAPLSQRPTEMLFNAVPQPKNEAKTEALEGYGYAPGKEDTSKTGAGNGKETPSFHDLRKAENEIFNAGGDGLPFAQSPAAAVSGSLAGLVNATTAGNSHPEPAADKPATDKLATDKPVADIGQKPRRSRPATTPEPSPLEETAAYTPDDLPAPPSPDAGSSHRFDFAAPATPKTESPAPAPELSTQEPSPALGATEAYSFDFDAFDNGGESNGNGVAIDKADGPDAPASASSPYLASSYESSYAPTYSAPAPGEAGSAKPAESQKSDGGTDHDGRTSTAEADDYLSSLLDTSSIPAVDFHIPSLTFPTSNIENDEKKS
ncbi:DivIVA domain-containing protein [Bifidobacterium catulorum]|uniref:Cell division protein DivIVA n=1 Tax=Bifidobacterium catulorum TaxID=1630173 RepID=A0A2U2MSA0_9BIFI|nr:DivIVA domain-containing protein [Bifidobacterium catulorum]PWG59704.1 hypothetical protein DF200_06080 [Bifidobacterium catulorum]